jgi:superfamily II DNA or RNA helicase
VIFSTIADEALDIPRLDRGYLAFPSKNVETVKQQIGRFTRTHDEKDSAIIYDFKDPLVGVLKTQFNGRLRGLYQPMKLKVEQFQ